jgi:hypothetical protein
MKAIIFALLFAVYPGLSQTEGPYLNQLTPAEEAAGFELLFDGQTRDNSKLVNVDGGDINWVIDDDALLCQSMGEPYSLCTYKEYASFELRLSMKLGTAGQNSGIFFRWNGRGMNGYMENTEFGIQGEPHDCDYPCHTGDNYSLQYATHYPQVLNEYNSVHIWANGNSMEFWVQGEKVNEFEILSDEWRDQHTSSAFSLTQHDTGYICIQDHGPGMTDQFWIRDYRIRAFEQDGRAPAPVVFIEPSGDSARVEMDVGMIGAVIRYTTDGTDPDENSVEYTEPFFLKSSATVKAATFRDPLGPSEIVSDDFVTDVIHARRYLGPAVRRGRNLEINIMHSGSYVLEMLNLKGEVCAREEGTGPRTCHLALPKERGMYVVRIKTGRHMYTRPWVFY